MITYLVYYSVGGYKVFKAGSTLDTGDKDGKMYYSSFLQPWLDGTLEISDEHTLNQLQVLKEKPQMEALTAVSDYKMPQMVQTLMTHAGYQIACCSPLLPEDGYTVAVRDILCNNLQDFSDSPPFMMQFVCDEAWEADTLTNNFRNDLSITRLILGSLLVYNPEYNCITFNVKSINDHVKGFLDLAGTQDNTSQDSNQKIIRQIVLSEGISLRYELKELGLDLNDVDKAYDASGKHLIHKFIPSNEMQDVQESPPNIIDFPNENNVSNYLNSIRDNFRKIWRHHQNE